MSTATEKKRRAPARRTLLPWVGGKSRSAREIAAALPPHRTYVEVFCGGCAVLWAKERSPVEVINDTDARLVDLLRVARYHPDALAAELLGWTHSRAEFEDALAQPGVTDVQRAARFLFVLASSFGAKVDKKPVFGYSRTNGPSLHRDWLDDTLDALRTRLDRVTVERLDFADAIRRYDSPETLFYCDPPYANTNGYARPFDAEEHRRLRGVLEGVAGRAVVSLGADLATRDLYRGWDAREMNVRYSVGGRHADRSRATAEVLLIGPA